MASGKDYNKLIGNEIYPDASAIFAADLAPLSECIGSADFVIDTNALLLPYGTGNETLKQLDEIYSRLIDEGRLFIPGQVAREFAKWRPRKLAELVTSIEKSRDQNMPMIRYYPLLEALEPYAAAYAIQKEMLRLRAGMRTHYDGLLSIIRSWNGNDPVSCLYRKLFGPNVVVEIKPGSNVVGEFEKRMAHGVPPGNKDTSKDDGGIGDYLIWQTILEIGESRRRPIVFISGDDKADWLHQANQRGVYVRSELVDEFRRASGTAFYILKFSDFMKEFDVPTPVVAEIEQEEERLVDLVAEIETPSRMLERHILSEYVTQSVGRWLRQQYSEVGDNSMGRAPGYDFICLSSDGVRTGVEVVTVERSAAQLRMKLKESIRRAVQWIQEGAADKALIIIGARASLPDDTTKVVDQLAASVGGNDRIRVIAGVCQHDHRFVQEYPMSMSG